MFSLSQWQITLLQKLLAFIAFLGIFILVVLYIEPPKSWPEASIFQIMAFFIPLLLAITVLIDIVMHYYPHSFIIALGIILALAFYGVNQLNWITGSLAVLSTAYFVRIFPKMKLPRFRLTSDSRIPKLQMHKNAKPAETPRIRRLRRIRNRK